MGAEGAATQFKRHDKKTVRKKLVKEEHKEVVAPPGE